MNGYYYCSFCKDSKHIKFTERYIECPDCKNFACRWTPNKPTPTKPTAADAADMFKQIREGIR